MQLLCVFNKAKWQGSAEWKNLCYGLYSSIRDVGEQSAPPQLLPHLFLSFNPIGRVGACENTHTGHWPQLACPSLMALIQFRFLGSEDHYSYLLGHTIHTFTFILLGSYIHVYVVFCIVSNVYTTERIIFTFINPKIYRLENKLIVF